jgi:hypothetical protein
VEYPIAIRIGGSSDTGVAPTATINVPNPILIIIICTALFSHAIVLMKMIILFNAPVFSMYAICKSEVATIKETGKDLIIPETVERNITSIEVLKNRTAIIEIAIHPTMPLRSAGFFQRISIHNIIAIGSNVSRTDMS